MASTPLPLIVPSLSFSLLALSSLSTSLGFCQVVLLRKGQVKQERVIFSPTPPPPSSTSFPPSFLFFFPHFTIWGLTLNPEKVPSPHPRTLKGLSLGSPIREDPSSFQCYGQALSECCTGASFQPIVKSTPRRLPQEGTGLS